MKPTLQLKLGQQLTMTPQLQQAIRLLQLSTVDLQAEIQEILVTNPLLEQEENLQAEVFESKEPLIWETAWLTQVSTKYNLYLGNSDLASQKAAKTTLKDYLTWQMQLTPFSSTDRQIAITLIDAINEDGFLDCSLKDIYDTLKAEYDIELNEIKAVLHQIQQFDPLGVAAQDLKECLLIQIKHLPEGTPWKVEAENLIANYLEYLGKKDYLFLKQKLNLSMDDLKSVITTIQLLNPRPGTEIGDSLPEYIVPDVYAFEESNQWKVFLNPDCNPSLNINKHYVSIIKQNGNLKDNQYLKTQLQEAKWFIKSLENRNETLLKVANYIVEFQKEFLIHGEEAMKPMILHDVAEAIDMHESTISRVTTQKYIFTPRGTFELKYFFSSHLSTASGHECSSTAIRALLKKLIAAENPNKPLSDSALVKLIEAKGIKIARRTVAKYREALSIPPSNERKNILS